MSINVRKCFGNSLKKIRAERKLTQEKLAEIATLEANSLSSLERGKTLSVSSLQKLCDGLELHPSAFFQVLGADETATRNELKNTLLAKINKLSDKNLRLLINISCALDDAPAKK